MNRSSGIVPFSCGSVRTTASNPFVVVQYGSFESWTVTPPGATDNDSATSIRPHSLPLLVHLATRIAPSSSSNPAVVNTVSVYRARMEASGCTTSVPPSAPDSTARTGKKLRFACSRPPATISRPLNAPMLPVKVKESVCGFVPAHSMSAVPASPVTVALIVIALFVFCPSPSWMRNGAFSGAFTTSGPALSSVGVLF